VFRIFSVGENKSEDQEKQSAELYKKVEEVYVAVIGDNMAKNRLLQEQYYSYLHNVLGNLDDGCSGVI